MTIYVKRAKHTNVRTTNIILRIIFTLFLIVTISPLIACTSLISNASPTDSTPTFDPSAFVASGIPLTIIADADARVRQSSPDTNHGNARTLQVGKASDGDIESFIRFTVTGVSGTVQSARLRLYVTTNGTRNGPAVYSTGTSWTETEITWNTRPVRTSNAVDNKDNISAGTWVEYDVTSLVTGNGTFSLVLAADSNDAVNFSSRQGSQPPELVIMFADGPTPTFDPSAIVTSTPFAAPGIPITFITEADAQVRQSSPDTNYGNATTLQVEKASDGDIESFIRFTVTGLSGTVLSARLHLYAPTNGTRNGPAVYSTDTSWTETEITWNTRPARTSNAVDNKDNISAGTWVEYDVTSLVTGNGTFSFVLAADSYDAVHFFSRQGSQPPELVITLSHSVTSTTSTASANDVIFVGAGDISSCEYDNDELTAQLLDTIPGTVFTTGDNVYESGTYTEYINCYEPTWGRHKARTQPVPGNHEYRTSGAAGYFQYFNSIPSYYVYSLGSWRIYALNSEIDVSANSPQITWLQADLAANPSQCVLAYWHSPRWSSGFTHGNSLAMQTLWQILYDAGAELVITGHEHNYERFAEMNATGATFSPGLRQIVIGTGGKDQYEFGTILPASEVRNSSTFGVLKLTLRTTGYDWQFVPVAGSTFTDSGSTSCH